MKYGIEINSFMTKFSSKIISSDKELDNKLNSNWWNDNPMTYDWDKNLGEIKLNKNYFSNIDKIFGYGHSLINNPLWPA